MWAFGKDAEEGLQSLHHNLKGLSRGKGVRFGYMGLIKVAIICGVAGACLVLGGWIMFHFLGLF